MVLNFGFRVFIYLAAALQLTAPALGARRVDAHLRARETKLLQRAVNIIERRALEEVDFTVDELLQLTEGESMHLARETNNALGTKVERLHQNYHGIPVFDTVVTVRTDSDGRLTGDASGEIIQNIADDLPDTTARLTDDETLELAIRHEGDEASRASIGSVQIHRTIYMDKKDVAHLANVVIYLIDGVKRPTYIIDLKTGEVLKHYDALDTFSCGQRTYKAYGGNKKAGKIKYGNIPYCLNPRIEGDMCYLENQYVRVVDMGFSQDEAVVETASFKCKNGYDDEVNDAFSPAVDAFFYGTVVGKMFEEWFQTTALHDQIVLRVHYGSNYQNAFWNGENTTFGDGGSDIYPFTSLDVVGHEIAHGVTEHGSNLMYYDESGGMNEAFSDIIGEAAEDFLASSDMVTGYDIMKHLPFMRDFEEPTLDNVSISQVDDMTSSADPHYSSGVYRRVWYVIVKQKDMPVRDAAMVFLHANRMYWHHSSTFYDCSCGLLKAAIDLGYSTSPFKRAFKDVGIADCDVNGHIFSLSNNITQHNVAVSADVRPVFRFEPPPWAATVHIEATNYRGTPITIELQADEWEEDDAGNALNVIATGVTEVEVTNATEIILLIRFSSDDLETNSDAEVMAGYTCVDSYDGDDSNVYRWYCFGL